MYIHINNMYARTYRNIEDVTTGCLYAYAYRNVHIYMFLEKLFCKRIGPGKLLQASSLEIMSLIMPCDGRSPTQAK